MGVRDCGRWEVGGWEVGGGSQGVWDVGVWEQGVGHCRHPTKGPRQRSQGRRGRVRARCESERGGSVGVWECGRVGAWECGSVRRVWEVGGGSGRRRVVGGGSVGGDGANEERRGEDRVVRTVPCAAASSVSKCGRWCGQLR